MLPMNGNSTGSTALLRGFYLFLGTLAVTAITAYLAFPDSFGVTEAEKIKYSILTGAIPALSALGFRVGVEGSSDKARQANGEVKPGDVQVGAAGKV